MNNNNNNLLIDENLRQLFNFWDSDRSGYLSRDEMRQLCARFSINVDESDAIFGDLDRDKDGRVSFEDFRTGFDDYEKGLILSSIDSNKDQTSTSESYGSLKKALETENISEKFGKNESFIENNNSIQNTINGFSEQYVSEGTHDSQQSAQTVIQELLESVRDLQEENKRLADSWMREKKEHEKHLTQLEEDVDSQVKEVEHRVKLKAKETVEAERKSMRELMKGEMEELQSHLSMFEKVDSWLKTNPNNLNEEKVNEIRTKLEESMRESRQLKMSLMDTQTNVALMRTELAQLRVQYDEKCRELSSEVGRVQQQQTEQQQLQRQLLLLQDANKRLHDTNDQLRTVIQLTPNPSRNPSPIEVTNNNNEYKESTPHIKRGSLIGDYIRNDSVGSYDYRKTFDRLSEVDLESMSPIEDEVYSVSNHSFASCPPMTSIKTIETNEDIDSGLSSLKTRSAQSSPVLTAYTKRSVSLKVANNLLNHINNNNNTSSHSISNMISEATGPPERTYKIIFIGDASVGKSTFILRLTKGYFASRLSTTLGVDFQVKIFNFDGKNVALQLWDTAGQERYRSITKNYFRKADGIMLLYDVTSEHSFLNVREWITAVEEVTAKGVPVMIVGNKTDLRPALMAQDLRYVKAEDGYKLTQQYGLMFVETSCKDGANIMSSIAQLTKIMTQNEDNLIESAINLKDTKPKRFGCCSK